MLENNIRYRLVILAAIPVAASSAMAQTNRALSKAEEEVRKLERDWLDEYEKRNVGAMNVIVADDLTIYAENVQSLFSYWEFYKSGFDQDKWKDI